MRGYNSSDDKKKSAEGPLPNTFNGGGEDPMANARREDERILGLTREYSGWDVYNNEAKKVDTELIRDWTASLNFLLLFAAIFAAVLTAFIIESKKLLEQDPTSVMVDVMIFFTNNVANGTHTPYTPVEFQPKQVDVIVNCLLYTSLSASLVAALASVVALQWVADYDAAITRGGSSPEDRAKRRQFRYAGVVSWRMSGIIAALPLLLYFSVLLFFVGLFLWMWNIHHVVGSVVAGGAALSILFYGASTMIAVVFVTAPFRTPISRWVYWTFHLPFTAIYRLGRVMQISTMPSWLEKRHFIYEIAYKREDQAVKERTELGKDALVWLANQLSISQDSSRRLLLLAGEIPNLQPSQMPSFSSSEASWYSIFDLLGWKYLACTTVEPVSVEDMQGMAILHRCYMLPEVQKLVSPPLHVPYLKDPETINYWAQYCEAGKGAPWSLNPDAPNRLFLLLRDILLPSDHSPQELELVVQLSYWRNLEIKPPQVWDTVFAIEDSFSTEFINACVFTFCSFYKLQNWYIWKPENGEIYHAILKRLVRIAADRDYFLPRTIVSLVQAYECSRIGYGDCWKSPNARLIRPILYGKAIQYSTGDVEEHEVIPYLLARQLHSYPLAEKSRQVRELISILWLRPSYPIPRNWSYLIEKYGSLNLPSQSDMVGWIKEANNVPRITDILRHLAIAQASDTSIGPLWRATNPDQVNDPHFIEALQTFARLMGKECTSDDHLTMISLLCQDLELIPPPEFDDYFTPGRLDALAQIDDPCLQTLVSCARGVAYLTPITASEDYKVDRRDSWDRIAQHLLKKYPTTSLPPVLRLQASIWPMYHGQRDIYQKALERPDYFLYLQRLFGNQIVCAECIEGPAHLLFHLLDSAFPRGFPKKLCQTTPFPFDGIQSSPLFITLCAWHAGEQLRLTDFFEPSDECSLQLLEESLDYVKSSQYHFLVLIWNATHSLRVKGIRAADLMTVLLGIHKALQLENEPESTSILAPISENILGLRNEIVAQGKGPFAQREAVTRRAIMASRLLLSSLATQIINGRRNSQMVSCARARGCISPLIGWQPPYAE